MIDIFKSRRNWFWRKERRREYKFERELHYWCWGWDVSCFVYLNGPVILKQAASMPQLLPTSLPLVFCCDAFLLYSILLYYHIRPQRMFWFVGHALPSVSSTLKSQDLIQIDSHVKFIESSWHDSTTFLFFFCFLPISMHVKVTIWGDKSYSILQLPK